MLFKIFVFCFVLFLYFVLKVVSAINSNMESNKRLSSTPHSFVVYYHHSLLLNVEPRGVVDKPLGLYPGVTSSILGHSNLSDETLSSGVPSPNDLSCWCDLKHKNHSLLT